MPRPPRPPAPAAPTPPDWRRFLPDRSATPERDGSVRSRAAVRLATVGLFVALGYGLLSARAAWLMLMPDERLERKAQVQFESSVRVMGRRGDLLDRDGRILATTVNLLELHADPSRLDVNQIRFLAEGLAPQLETDVATLIDRLSKPGRQDVQLAKDLTPDEAAGMKALAATLAKDDHRLRNVLWTQSAPRRFYPGGHEAAPLLGVVGRNGVGMAGMESMQDRTLRGRVFKYITWRDRKGRRVTPKSTNAEGGQTLVLSIDRRIQHAVELALDEAMERTVAEAAFAVVVDVKTGDLLAVGNRPTMNANDTTKLDQNLLKNRAAMDAIEPGSVFKPFVAAAALEEGLVTPDTIIGCEGGAWRVGRSVIHDDHPKGDLSVSDVIKYSSNIGAAKLAFLLEAQRTTDYLREFGFGRYTGLQFKGETRGIMRSPNNIKPIELATTAFGQGVTSNTLQLAYALATLGNGGVRMQPRLVVEQRDEHGELLKKSEPTVDRRVVSEKVARQVVAMMKTVTEEGGTGTRARIPGYAVAGKTGTAQKVEDGVYSPTKRIGSFVGLVPADDPRLAIAFVVDTPTEGLSYGGVVAGPGFAAIGATGMRVLGIPPDPALLDDEDDDRPGTAGGPSDPDAIIAMAPTAAPELQWTDAGNLRVPDLSGLSLRDALVTLQGAGLSIRTHGSGRVVAQSPASGTPLPPGGTVEVTLD
jgi:cell division protein FtsI (penicillin-binding protein 3)